MFASSYRLTSTACRRHLSSAAAAWPGWEVVVGIEVHAQIKSRLKLFSEAPTPQRGDAPNTRVSAFDAAWPGTLPRLNRTCVDLAVRTALACGSQVQLRSSFDRKHYFYADLPAGYQITQHYAPLARGGRVFLEDSPGAKAVGIIQIQLEQDTAKSSFNGRDGTAYIDLNRAGSALMEIVSQPDIRDPQEAGAYVRALQSLLRAVGSSDGNMEQGSLRCDVNVSVNRPGQPFGTRCEVKNLNSVKFLRTAITSEVQRHIELLARGEPVPQETRGFDEDRMVTYRLRSKEDSPDYRYMPDANLPPLYLDEAYIERVRAALPELPSDARRRLKEQYALDEHDVAKLLSVDTGRDVVYDGETRACVVPYFEAVACGRNPKMVVNWINNELLAELTRRGMTFSSNPVSAAQLGALLDHVQDKKMTGTSAREVLRHIVGTGTHEDVPTLMRALGLDAAAEDDIPAFCAEAVRRLPEEAAAVRRGNARVLMKLVGMVVRLSRGRADAVLARRTLEEMLRGP